MNYAAAPIVATSAELAKQVTPHTSQLRAIEAVLKRTEMRGANFTLINLNHLPNVAARATATIMQSSEARANALFEELCMHRIARGCTNLMMVQSAGKPLGFVWVWINADNTVARTYGLSAI